MTTTTRTARKVEALKQQHRDMHYEIRALEAQANRIKRQQGTLRAQIRKLGGYR